MKVGVISDTHGLLRPEAISALDGVDHILHAGDLGRPDILPQLETIAPVTAIRGNVDRGEWAHVLPETEAVELAGHLIYLLHDLADIDLDPAAAGFSLVVSGHTHRPDLQMREGVAYLNPGSAGPFRFRLPCTMAYLILEPGSWTHEFVTLVDRSLT